MLRRDETPRDLLFGLLALQVGLIDQDQLVAAFGAWSRARGKALAEILVDRGSIDEESRSLLASMAEKQLKLHGGDVEKSLATVATGPSTRAKLAALGDTDLTFSVGLVGSGSPGQDASATLSVGIAPGDGRQRFRVLRPHARGGLGAVFVAMDGELNREVALKQILDQHADDPTSRTRFLIEAEITGGLEHPGIVPVYGLGSDNDGRPYYAMRFIRGDSLKAAIAAFHADESLKGDPGRRSLALRELLRRFVDVCNAIDYAHGRGVLHRDLKPGNVIVGRHGETLVVDWGLAKPMGHSEVGSKSDERTLMPSSSSGSAETLPGSAIGTPAYMSPEQAIGALETLGPRSDVYSLGATLYSLLTGLAPFQGTDLGAVLRDVQNGAFPPPRQVDASIDRALEAVCLKAMAKAPEARHASARALADDIERWAADEPTSAWAEPFSIRARRWMRRNRSAVASLGAILVSAVVALAVGLVAVERERGRTADQRDRAGRALEEVRREKGRADNALIAEIQARKRTREVLDQTSSEVVEKFLATQGSKLGPDQEAFLKKMLENYTAFAAEPGSDPETRAASAKAHGRVGTMHSKMGRPQEAEAFWLKAAALYGKLAAETPDPVAYLAEQSGYLHKAAVVAFEAGRLKEAERVFRSNLEIERGLIAKHPKNLDLVKDLARTLEVLGNLLKQSGRGPEAEDSYRGAEDALRRVVADPAAKPAYRSALAGLLINRGIFLADSDRSSEAESAYREAVEIRRRLAADFPRNTDYRSDIATSLSRLAYLSNQIGKSDEADAAYVESLAINKDLADEFPSVTAFRANLAANHGDYAIFLAGVGRQEKAEASFRAALALNRQIAADYPSVTRNRSRLAASLTNLGAIYTITNRKKEAEAAYREAIEIKKRLAAEVPEATQYQSDLGRLFYNLAIILDGDAKEAAYREGIAILRTLTSRPSRSSEDQFLLAQTLRSLASDLDHARNGSEAEALLLESAGLYDQVVARAPSVSLYREEQANGRNARGVFFQAVGRLPEAEASFREAIAGFGRLVADVPGDPGSARSSPRSRPTSRA